MSHELRLLEKSSAKSPALWMNILVGIATDFKLLNHCLTVCSSTLKFDWLKKEIQ